MKLRKIILLVAIAVILSATSASVRTRNVSAQDGDCSGAPPNYLRINDIVLVDGATSIFHVFNTPANTTGYAGEMYEGEQVRILDGPICNGGDRWWKVLTGNGVEGWTQDGDGIDYPRFVVMIPAPIIDEPPPSSNQCLNAPPLYLAIGDQATVAPGEPNNLRDGPSISNALIAKVYSGDLFVIIDGPVCADDLRWWRIRLMSGMEGWTADGTGNVPWLTKNVIVPQPITLTPSFTPMPTYTNTIIVSTTPSYTPTRMPTFTPTPTPTFDNTPRTRVLGLDYAYFPAGYEFYIDAEIVGHPQETIDVLAWFQLLDGTLLQNAIGDPAYSNANGNLVGWVQIHPCCDDTVYLRENNQAIVIRMPYAQFPIYNTGFDFIPILELRSNNEVIASFGREDGSPQIQVGRCDGDQDCDGLSDQLEQWMIDTYKPVLEFDENESVDPATSAAIYQVSPGWYHDMRGVWITVVLVYPRDDGLVAMNIEGWNHLTCAGLGDIGAAVANEGFDEHLGDTEALRIFVADIGNNSWQIQGLLLKRHYDPYESYIPDDFEWRQSPPGEGEATHPLIFVSESKHGMYSSADECANYTHEFMGICEMEIEDCGNDDHPGAYMNLYTPPEQNVGERYAPKEVFLASDLLRSMYPPERAWLDQPFCAGDALVHQEVTANGDFLSFEVCAGGIYGKWLPLLSNCEIYVGEECAVEDDLKWQRWTLQQLDDLEVLTPAEYAPIFGR